MVRTRFAPSPTGHMHLGNLRTALYEYLIARKNKGSFILRIEDTDQNRFVEGAVDIIYNTLKLAGISHDEGPDVGGPYGPYVQSQRKDSYVGYARELVEKGKAYYCFCSKERLEGLQREEGVDAFRYDRHCHGLSQEEAKRRLDGGEPYVIRQLIPDGTTTFHDTVYGDITIDNGELDDQILIKSDGMPTYNFANVVDDHLMKITHVVRGSEYLSSTPKYNLLYQAFGWEIPTYVHLPLLLNEKGEKLSKRRGDASFEDLLALGYLPEAIINYVAFLGWSPGDNQEIFILDELEESFSEEGISKSPSSFDITKLSWMNGEHIKRMEFDRFYQWIEPYMAKAVKTPGLDRRKLAAMVQSRINLPADVEAMLDFIDALPDYSLELYNHKKMKTDGDISLTALGLALPVLEDIRAEEYANDTLYAALVELAGQEGLKNSQVLWPVRTALSGKAATPCGATELLEVLGKNESLERIRDGMERLKARS